MTNGRGVVVPKLGHFTFTAMEVNLQGTTNPQIRDRQLRVQHGASGVIPKVKCNYFEIATISGLSKD